MIKTAAFVFCAAASFHMSALAVNKCQVNGKTVYQDTPCLDGGSKVDATPNGATEQPYSAPPGRTRSADRAKAEPLDVPVDHRAVLNGMATGKPVVGMTENQLKIAVGNPDRVNTGDYRGRRADQLIYERDGATYYVYVRDGVVSSVQSSIGYPSRKQKQCPSSIEIRNLETSASSMTLSDSERRDLQHRVWRARNCM